ncbi:GNAT family N-acetyltransferase [Heyndrickxia oleronia]|uniref:GNAT family N-acetyltransferase n=1 Tax=Heyndrickxia oleronia TaxID=38875 RepID=A0AAW6SZV1_9BACI|nr:GNAT family N-acetyltransferase [Heyndrickxia oleronia]MDH5164320.1 GNAT family N-acetyltransferase [Heyndrickxia oleronia]
MDIKISPFQYEDKPILDQLIQLYRYDSSEFDGHCLNAHGRYSYKYLDHQWTEDYRKPYMVRVDGEIAGFALIILDVPKEYTKLSSAEKTNVISDFFIMRKFRRKGVGKKVAHLLFDESQGVWEIKQTISNKQAYSFWKYVIKSYEGGNLLQEEMLQTEQWNGPVLLFQS